MGTPSFFTRRNATIGIIFFILVVGVLFIAPFFEAKRLTIDVFDIGQGDAIFITTPSRERILVDGGPDATIVAKLFRRLGFFNRTIDLIIPTHPQADHITGLIPVLKKLRVARVMLSQIRNETPEYKILREKIAEYTIPTLDAGEISTIMIGEGDPVTLDVLWPRRSYGDRLVDDPNTVSTVFRLTYHNTRFLFTGDADAAIEQALLEDGVDLRADVLKVGHHGSDTSTTEAFLDAVDPSVAVISVGKKNHFGHPSRRVLRRLEQKGVRVYRTDLNGDVRITSDGRTITVKPQR